MLSDSIIQDRAGNFTASEAHRLMAGWDAQKPKVDIALFPNGLFDDMAELMAEATTKPLVRDFTAYGCKVTREMINQVWAWLKHYEPPAGLVTYAEEKAIESLFDQDPSLNWSTVHTRNGEEREPECMEMLADATGIDFAHTGDDQIHLSVGDVGCTPDGIVFDDFDLVHTGAEAKCKSAAAHAKNILIDTAEQMKAEAFDHYCQIQTQMMVTGADHWYFANYNPFAKQKWMRFKYIILGRDDAFIKIIKQRLDVARQIKAEYLGKFKEQLKHAA
jgi:hypothetical protein